MHRFREYLGKRYLDKDMGQDEKRENKATSLPIIAMFILGFDLEKALPACVKVDRRYVGERTRDIHRRLQETVGALEAEGKQAEEERKQKEEVRRLKEEVRKQKEEVRRLKEEIHSRAVRALVAAGLSEEEARRTLEKE